MPKMSYVVEGSRIVKTWVTEVSSRSQYINYFFVNL